MKKKMIFNVLAIFLLTVGFTVEKPKLDKTVSESETAGNVSKMDKKGFQPLFNGKDFNDWELLLRAGEPGDIEKVYTIDNGGILHFFRDLPEGSGAETRKNAFHGVMVTKKSYSKYHLKFEFKWGKKLVNNFKQFQYDAGVFYQIEQVKVFPTGLQYQIRYNHVENRNHAGDFWAAGVSMQWYSEDGVTFKLPSEGGVEQPIKKGEHRALADAPYHGLDGKWNKCELIVMGNAYAIHKLNGKLVNMATNLGQSEGPIALEAETGEIFWRNIEIKEFDESVPMEKFLH